MIPEDAEQRNASFRSSSWLHHWLERLIFGSRLVFNQTWEDPLVDRHALAITQDDVLVTIASAGDNVLALSLDKPKHIYAVDLNPAQISLLQLKIIAAQQLKYADFWYLFSLNPAPHARSLYYIRLRQHLDQDAQQFWDRHISEFRRGLGRSGVFGRSLWLLRMYLRMVCGQRTLAQLFEASSSQHRLSFIGSKSTGGGGIFLLSRSRIILQYYCCLAHIHIRLGASAGSSSRISLKRAFKGYSQLSQCAIITFGNKPSSGNI